LLFAQTGPIIDRFHWLGLPWSSVFLLDCEKPVLFEAGFACAAKLYEKGIRSVLGARRPEYLFLTHSHWDHCGSTAYLKKAFPGLKTAASKRTADVLKRPNALSLIKRLSDNVRPLVAAVPGVDPNLLLEHAFQPFTIDTVIAGGRSFQPEKGLTIQVLATPGHTRDQLSYYIPEKRILIATEAVGVLDKAGNFLAEFLVDYDAYIASMKRLALLPIEVLCQGHHYVFVGKEEVEKFLIRSLSEAERFKDKVCELLRMNSGLVEPVAQRIKAEEWDTNKGIKQSEEAYLINLRAMIGNLAERQKGMA
jgi:2-aminobenzoylacetyl-CoA thioesterase